MLLSPAAAARMPTISSICHWCASSWRTRARTTTVSRATAIGAMNPSALTIRSIDPPNPDVGAIDNGARAEHGPWLDGPRCRAAPAPKAADRPLVGSGAVLAQYQSPIRGARPGQARRGPDGGAIITPCRDLNSNAERLAAGSPLPPDRAARGVRRGGYLRARTPCGAHALPG